MSRAFLLALLVAGAALVASAAALAADPVAPRVTELGDAHFPDRGYILTLPTTKKLTADDVEITENGRPVTGITVVPTTALGSNEFALALVIDASESMRGEPIRKAMAAARAFAAQRQPTQRLGALVYNAKPSLLVPFTTDGDAIGASLANTPPVAYYTRTFDALLEAVSLIRSEQIGSASIVLLSDGRELGSKATLEEAVEAAQAAHVRIFSVALRSRSFDPATLQSLASQTGGFYTEARSAEQLARIFTGLGSQLANEYFVHYRSLAGPGEEVTVRVDVAGFSQPAVSGYRTPALPKVYTDPFERPLSERVLLSGWLMVLVGLVTAALVALSLLALIVPRRSTLRNRIGAFVSLARPQAQEERRRPRGNRTRLVAPAEGDEKQSWWARFQEELEVAGIEASATSIALWTAAATVLGGWLLLVITDLGASVFMALAVPVAVRVFTKTKLERKRRQFGDQLPDNLEVLASALRAGHSLVGALSVVVADAAEPSQSELRRVVADEQLGIPLEDAIGIVVRRMDNRDLDQVALVARLQRETGANSVEVLERVIENVRARQEVRRLVRTLTAQGRLSGWVLVGLPLFMLLFLVLFNRDYVEPLFTRALGRGMLLTATMMVLIGFMAIRKIINIKV